MPADRNINTVTPPSNFLQAKKLIERIGSRKAGFLIIIKQYKKITILGKPFNREKEHHEYFRKSGLSLWESPSHYKLMGQVAESKPKADL